MHDCTLCILAEQMYASSPAVAPGKYSGVRVMLVPGKKPPPGGLPINTHVHKEKSAIEESNYPSHLNAERELEFMNHCFDDVERFMARLQQTAEAQSVLNQRGEKKSRKSKKKTDNEDGLLALKACPPSAEEFVDLFQKIKYSLSLLDRLKSAIVPPYAPELLHHIFVPLKLMMQTTGGPALGASVVSPAMTSGAVSLLQEHLIAEEKTLWTSLGANWTSPCAHLDVSVPPYSPVFLDGWKPQAYDSTGQLFEDPIESQHKQDALRESRSLQDRVQQTAELPGEGDSEVDGTELPPEGERLYCCSYDFVARNSSELSVLQGETLEKMPVSPPKFFSYAPSSPVGTSPISPMRPQSMFLPSMQGEDNDRVLMMNDELLQRLSEKRAPVRPTVVSRTADTSPLSHRSPPAEVKAWLTTKGFSPLTVQGLGILNGAQIFSLEKEELRAVAPEEGARVYSQIMVQKALLQDVHKSSELEKVMERQKLKIGLNSEDDSV
ncbi:Epidermal growth factor receptor kinase substrate 8-like protein 1 [Liparis tanakae]|uniref:Epidermal growth factor receptor kinase substrate 8-like protein 1 n=1 Tax=Liparis tanakae TaxID=230148 RepID=A0A4Z2J1V5_9TELE|nr:Epidermal growth factor receptor kinase substrate 8-like protein 1 [Liparis tanakae]